MSTSWLNSSSSDANAVRNRTGVSLSSLHSLQAFDISCNIVLIVSSISSDRASSSGETVYPMSGVENVSVDVAAPRA